MTKINSVPQVNNNYLVNVKTTEQVVSEKPVLSLSAQDKTLIEKKPVVNSDPFGTSNKKVDITQTKNFKTVFPNFDILDKSKQESILNKLSLIQKKYPDFVNNLAKVDNPQHGEGFQFFFVPDKADKNYNKLPGVAIADKAMGDSAIGIVFGGSGGVLENSILKTPIARLSQSVINDGVFGYKLDTTRKNLDIGGMFTSVSEDTFSHEMGHVIHSYVLNNAERGELWSIYIKSKDNDKFLTDYSKTNHMEFFGEAIEAYLKQDSLGNFIEREDLKKKNPELYNFTARVIDSDVSRGTAQSKVKSLSTITSYGVESAYTAGKNFLSEKLGKK